MDFRNHLKSGLNFMLHEIQKPATDKRGVLKNFAKFTEELLCQSLFFARVAGLRPAALLKKRFWHDMV